MPETAYASGLTIAQLSMTPSHRALLDALKRRGRATVPELAGDLALNVETIRDHLRTLAARALIRRDGTAQHGPGRPEIVFMLTPAAEALFPRREGEILRALGRYLIDRKQSHVLRGFFDAYVGARRDLALARVGHLTGRTRLKEVVRIFDEMGFMPVLDGKAKAPRLRLCHCPLRDLVEVTRIPCRAELGLLSELLGERPTRVGFIPDGDAGCSYQLAILP